MRISVRMLLETIFANMETLKLKCSKENNTVLCIIISRKAYVINDLLPILGIDISS